MKFIDWTIVVLCFCQVIFYIWMGYQEYRKRKAYDRLIRNGWITKH